MQGSLLQTVIFVRNTVQSLKYRTLKDPVTQGLLYVKTFLQCMTFSRFSRRSIIMMAYFPASSFLSFVRYIEIKSYIRTFHSLQADPRLLYMFHSVSRILLGREWCRERFPQSNALLMSLNFFSKGLGHSPFRR
jgi:hypothetical protein